jgi:hypothetical protein
MIAFHNPQSLKIYASFISEFGERLKSTNSDNEKNIYGINQAHDLSVATSSLNDPFATNTIVTPSVVVMNDDICNTLQLTDRECFAFILHEIGHIMDKTPLIGNEELREINADQFAVNFRMSQELISGLSKILDSNNYENLVEGIRKRVDALTTSM